MKKGFTIVELAIVLVVIGIILAMAVKGRNLVEAARYKAEINKIRKLEAAVHIWLATHPEIPNSVGVEGQGNWGHAMLNYFYDNGILTPSDLQSMAIESLGTSGGPGQGKNGIWTPMFCQYYKDGIANYASWHSVGAPNPDGQTFKGSNFCAMLFIMVEPNPSSSWSINMPRRLQCYIEQTLDDMNVKSGTARYDVRYSPAIDFTEDEYKDCMAQPMVESTNSDLGVVIY
jgi:prepilin-type N-terminal cleavage/methylation domain-containing protein